MKPSFTVTADVDRSLLRIDIFGFFDVATVARLAKERNAAVARLRCGANRHLTLCDARGAELSSPEVTEAFQHLIGDPRYASRRLAYVTTRALGRIQATRVLGRKDIAFFEDPAPALAWLYDDSAELSA